MLRRYISNPSHVISQELLALDPDLSYEEHSIQILYNRVKELRNKKIHLVKVLWRNLFVEEVIWDTDTWGDLTKLRMANVRKTDTCKRRRIHLRSWYTQP